MTSPARKMDALTRVSIKNILYPTDLSPAADGALPYVLGLAGRYGATVHALHVTLPAPYFMAGPEGMPQAFEAAKVQSQLEFQRMDKMLAGVPHEIAIESGDIWSRVKEFIEQRKIDMIVIGTHGRTGVGRALLGSVAEEIFRQAPCPVLTVGPRTSVQAEQRLEMKEILYATDFSDESRAAAPYAISLAQEHQARLTLLHVMGEPKTGELVHPENYMASTLRQLQSLVPPEAEPWCKPSFKIESGAPAEEILEAAASLGADLIVLGVRGASQHLGATTHLLRPTAHRVVTQAGCPVLTVRG